MWMRTRALFALCCQGVSVVEVLTGTSAGLNKRVWLPGPGCFYFEASSSRSRFTRDSRSVKMFFPLSIMKNRALDSSQSWDEKDIYSVTNKVWNRKSLHKCSRLMNYEAQNMAWISCLCTSCLRTFFPRFSLWFSALRRFFSTAGVKAQCTASWLYKGGIVNTCYKLRIQ